MAESIGKKNRAGNILFLVSGIVVSIVGMWYAFHNVSLAEVKNSFFSIEMSWWPLIASIGVYWAGLVIIRAILLQYLLKSQGTIGLWRAYRCLCIGFLANNILPFRIGDVARSAAVSRGSGIPFPTVLGSMALERMLDMAMVALLAFAALQVAPMLSDDIRTAATWTAIVLGVVFAVLIVLARKKHGTAQEKSTGLRRLWDFIWGLWLRFSSGFHALSSARGLIIVVALAAVLWALGLWSMMLRLSAFGLPGSVSLALVLFTCLGFAVAVPSGPGYVGVYQALVVVALTAMGVSKDQALTFGLFSWALDMILGIAAGLVSMVFEGMKFSDLKAPAE